MFWFVIAIIAALIGVIMIAKRRVDTDSGKLNIVGFGVILIVIAFGLFAVSGLKHVPGRNIGIPSTFSQVGATAYGPGYHETWDPFLNLTDATETIQVTTFTGCWGQYCTSDKQPRGNCLEVRIGGQQTACVDVTIKWQMNKSTAGRMYLDYANQEDNLVHAVRDYLVTPELRKAENDQLDAYNPILDSSSQVPGAGGGSLSSGKNTNSQYLAFANKVVEQVTKELGSQVTVLSVVQPLAYYNASTESFLHQIQNKAAEDQVALEQQKVNADTKTAFDKLGNPTVAQLINLCLNSTAPHAAGWTCWPGAGSNLAISSNSK